MFGRDKLQDTKSMNATVAIAARKLCATEKCSENFIGSLEIFSASAFGTIKSGST